MELKRFLDAQNQVYLKALAEIQSGRKTSHWMWFVFPQLLGLGYSEMSKFYGIRDLEEATHYLSHPVLGKHLIEITTAVLESDEKSVAALFGSPDDLKLQSCMTLFASIHPTDPLFEKVLAKYFDGVSDTVTLQLLKENKRTDATI